MQTTCVQDSEQSPRHGDPDLWFGEDTRPILRKDAARNRRRILQAARAIADRGKPLQLNVVAHRANVGVATVYRHFPTPEALTEALAADRLALLIREVEAAPPTVHGLRRFLSAALAVFVRDHTLTSALVNPVTDTVQDQRRRLLDGLTRLLTGLGPAVSPALAPSDIVLILCGVGFALRHSPGHLDPAVRDRYLKVLLVGLLSGPACRGSTCDGRRADARE